MSNWYSQFKQSEWDQFSKSLILTLGLGGAATLIALHFHVPQQEAQRMVQEHPAEAEALLQQLPPEAIQRPQETTPIPRTEPQQEVPEKYQPIGIEDIANFISDNEGFEAYAYQDTPENKSIGYGYNLERSDAQKLLKNMGYNYQQVYNGKQSISQQHAIELRNHVIEEALGIANDFMGGLYNHPPIVQTIIVDMTYNMGGTRLNGFVKLKKAINIKDYELAAKEMIDSKWFREGQTGNRAKRLVEMMQSATR